LKPQALNRQDNTNFNEELDEATTEK
jgi:hypothetical protein